MADTKISALTVATTPLAGTEVLPIVQSGVTKQVSVANLTAGRAVSADSLTLTGSPLPATSGGTGQSSYAVGDLLYASTTTALSKLADVATGNALISGGVGVAPSWGKIGLATHVSGTLGTANGGTGLTSFTANGILYASSTSALATSSNLNYTSGNLGLAATPSSWSWPDSSTGALQLQAYAALSGYNATTYLSNNWYYNAGEKFMANGYATRYGQGAGGHYWSVSNASNAGGAGAGVTWLQVMQTHASGGVSIGSTTDPGAGNLLTSGNAYHGATNTTGSISNTKMVVGGGFYTLRDTVSANHNTATTLFGLPTGTYGTFFVTALVAASDATNYQAVSLVCLSNSSATITAIKTAANISISLSGTNVQGTQTSGSTTTIYFQACRVGYA